LSTAHRIVTELVEWQVLSRDADGRYCVAGLPGEAPCPLRLREAAATIVADLGAVTGCAVRLGVLSDARISYVEKVSDTQPLSAWSAAATQPGAGGASVPGRRGPHGDPGARDRGTRPVA
jgi:DNA-binding IclR family transcriptional regulator